MALYSITRCASPVCIATALCLASVASNAQAQSATSGHDVRQASANFSPATPKAVEVLKVEFGKRVYFARISNDLISSANELCLTLHSDYQNNPKFKDIYAQTYTLLQDSKTLRTLLSSGAHSDPDFQDKHVEEKIHKLDQSFTAIQSDLRALQNLAERPVKPQKPEKKQLSTIVDQFEESLHLLMEDYGIKSQIRPRKNQQASPPKILPAGGPVR